MTLTVSAGHLKAQSVPSTFQGVSPGLSTKGTLDGSTTKVYKAGLMRFDTFDGFCVDPHQLIYQNQTVNYTKDLTFSTPAVSDAIAHLVGGYYASGQTAQDAASIQWAIWEVIVDGVGSTDLTSGNSRVLDTATANLAESYLQNIGNLPKADVVYMKNVKFQDMVTVVPEPSSSLLLSLGACGLLLRRKRS